MLKSCKIIGAIATMVFAPKYREDPALSAGSSLYTKKFALDVDKDSVMYVS
jgi:hypothetical protein